MVWYVIGCFLLGSVPFSVLIGKVAGNVDIREYGDANPGATNVGAALGPKWGFIAVLADGLKAMLPVGAAYWYLGFNDWRIIPIALAPTLGHAYSPFLRFKGGKAVAATFGAWAGITGWVSPILMGVLLGVWYTVVETSGWAVIVMMLCFGAFVGLYYQSPILLGLWGGHLLLLLIKHREDLSDRVAIRSSLLTRMHRLLGR